MTDAATPRALVTAARELLARGEVTAVSYVVFALDGPRWGGGWRGGGEGRLQPLAASRRFDLASLTKPFVATLALVLDASGELPLGTRLGEVFAGVHPGLARRSLEALLRHRSGLAAWTPLRARADGPEGALRWLLAGGDPAADDAAGAPPGALRGGPRRGRGGRGRARAGGPSSPPAPAALPVGAMGPPAGEPGGQGQPPTWQLLGHPAPTYSDLGYILAGRMIEGVLGERLWPVLQRRVVLPLGLAGVAAPGPRREALPSPLDGGREQRLAAAQGLDLPCFAPVPPGNVQDGNARFLLGSWRGRPPVGTVGHAGLFGAASDVAGLLAEWLAPGRLLDPERVRRALRGARPIGWAPARARGSAGRAVGRSGFGHLGSTGGSAWADPERGAGYVLLAHRASWDVDLRRFRQRFHQLAAAVLERTR
jgi:CubicO group peptidase (beta-lactamase class C family)